MDSIKKIFDSKLSFIFENEGVKEFIKFIFVGMLNTVVAYGSFFLLLKLGIYYVISSLASFVIMIIHSYIWNRYFTFKSKGSLIGEILRFVSVHGLVYLASVVFLIFCVEFLHLKAEFVGFISLFINAALSFIGHKRWSFRK